MNEPLLEALSTLYHNPDQEAKKRASLWLEEWRLNREAWNAADAILHSGVRNGEVLFFCAQTLVFKARVDVYGAPSHDCPVQVRQDFEELPQEEIPRLRDSLVALLLTFSQEEGMDVVQKQLALAIAAFCAHAPSSLWAPQKCIPWLAERLWKETDVASVSSLMELLVVFPEEARNDQIGLHPKRRQRYQGELQESFPTVLDLLQKSDAHPSGHGSIDVTGTHGVLGSFVQLAMASLEQTNAFDAAVDFLSELLYAAGSATFMPEMAQLAEGIATSLVQHAWRLMINETPGAQSAGLARLFCDLGSCHEDIILAQNETADAILGAILAATADHDEEVHCHTFDFWERSPVTSRLTKCENLSLRTTNRVTYLMKGDSISEEQRVYFRSVFERLMTALLKIAESGKCLFSLLQDLLPRLPDDYLEMSEEERGEIPRRAIQNAMMDAVDVLGAHHALQSVVTALISACQDDAHNSWQRIEALLFALTSVFVSCSKCKFETVGPLFQALGSVPDAPVIQSAMCRVLATYASWIPVLVDQTGSDPLSMLIPAILKNMSNPEWSAPAVDAFVGLCKSCRGHLYKHTPQLLELQQQVLQAADAYHQWIPESQSGFLMRESAALEVMGALIHGISKSESVNVAQQFLWTVGEGLLQNWSEAVETTEVPFAEKRLMVLVGRLKTFFRSSTLRSISSELFSRVWESLLVVADRAAERETLVEEICTCLRYAVKSTGEAGSAQLPRLTTALPQLFSASRHCGFLYVTSEVAKVFGRTPEHVPSVHQMIMEQFRVVCGVFQTPADFRQRPDLADDTFLMAVRVLNYCPNAILKDPALLSELIDMATKGVLVQHEDACRSILTFFSELLDTHGGHALVQSAFQPRGPFLAQILLAGVMGGLPLRVLDDVSRTLRSILKANPQSSAAWISQILSCLPDTVLTAEEKTALLGNLCSERVQKSERAFLREIDDLANVCRRSRVVQQAAQLALTPESFL